MSLKKISVFGLAFSLFGLFVLAPVRAEAKPVVVAKTISVAPLHITFEPSSKNGIEGKVTGTYIKEDIENIMFTLAGDFDGDGDREKHEFRFDWEARYRDKGEVFLTFNFNLAYIGLAENFSFRTDFLNSEENRVATGTRRVKVRRTAR